MVQREIKKKVPVYGLIGILSAVVLVAMIFSYGTMPTTPGGNPSPSVNPSVSPSVSPSVLPSTGPSASPAPTDQPVVNPEPSAMENFASYDDLKNFIVSNSGGNYWGRIDGTPLPAPMPTSTPMVIPSPAPATVPGFTSEGKVQSGDASYTVTNIQVAGVDEADKIKTDGTYFYTIANNTVFILDAGASNPQDARVISKILNQNGYVSGIYLSQDGSKLVVLGSQYNAYPVDSRLKDSTLIMPPNWGGSTAFVRVYDVTNKANPALVRNYTISGSYFNSRMIGNYVYAIITENAYVLESGSVNLPIVFGDKAVSNIAATSILYIPNPSSYYSYTSVIGINVADSTAPPTNTTIMMGGSSEMYVSASNIYLTTQNWNSRTTTTNIYRVSINQTAISAKAQGFVPGYPINQYAMDEYNGNFRIATTAWTEENATTSDGAVFKVSRQINSIYVLGSDLKIVGKLERFKMDENLYSARFMGDKCYIVTAKQIDPFFIIDMSNPAAPRVAGELKIPGFSSYLHPVDATHIIGLGKENSTLKLSLFDVSNMNQPTEVAKYIVEASYSDSSALYDPHAFLYDAQKRLLVIPVSINDMPVIIMPVMPANPAAETKAATSQYWQGAYVFNVDAATGFTLKGQVTQVSNTATPDTGDYYWQRSSYWITRSAFISNTLYTFSDSAVQLNSITDFATLAKVELK